MFLLFASIVFSISVLAVNVVVCPIIYVFVCVVCVLANSFTNMFNMFSFSICEYKVDAYQ